MIKLDLKKFKHIKSDDASTTLRHQDGHELTIAHKALSPKMQEQLNALATTSAPKADPVKMAKGGKMSDAEYNKYVTGKMTQYAPTSVQQSDTTSTPAEKVESSINKTGADAAKKMKAGPGTSVQSPQEGYAKGGKVKMYADPEDQVSSNDSAPSKNDPNYDHSQDTAPIDTSLATAPYDPEESARLHGVGDDEQPITEKAKLLYNQGVQNKNANDPMANIVPGSGYTPKDQLFTIDNQGQLPNNFNPKVFNSAEDSAKFQQDEMVRQEDAKLQAQQDMEAKTAQAAKDVMQPESSVGQAIDGVPQSVANMKPITPGEQPFAVPRATGSMTQQLNTAAENVLGGQELAANAKIQESNENQKAIQNSIAAQQAIQNRYEKHFQGIEQERQALIHDINAGHIDTEKYWDNHSRIATGLGMIISGFGGVEGVKQATDFLQKEQEQNIQAQVRNLSSKETLLAHNIQQYGNFKDGMTATRIAQNDILTMQLQKAAAKAMSPLAKAAALQAAGTFQKENISLGQDLAMRQTALSTVKDQAGGQLSKEDPAMLVRYLVPQEHQKQVFAETEAAQNTRANTPAILRAFDDANNKLHTADFIPGVENVHQKALHALLGPTFKDVEGTVRQAAMDNLYSSITPQFGDTDAQAKVKKDALMGYLTSKSSAPTAKGYGIDLSKFDSTSPYAAPQIKISNGIKYMRGPNGEKIRVK